MRTLTRSEWEHFLTALSDYRDVVNSYPEVITNRQEDALLVAEEIVREHTDTRHRDDA